MGTATDSDDDFLADVDDKDLDEWADEDFDDLDDVDLDAGDASATAPAAAQPPPPSAQVTQGAAKVVEAQAEEEEEEEEEEKQVNPFVGFGGWGAKAAKPSDDKPQSSGWGWSKTFSKMSSVVSSVADAVDGQLAELQSKVADMVVPEPEEEDAQEQGETSGAAIDDHRKREALMAKFGEAADGDEMDDHLKALDDQMEDLAMNAMGFLGQAWKGANKLAASAAEELQEGLKDVKELHLVQVVQSGAQRVASKGVGALERLGDTALDLLARPTGWDRDRSALDDMAPQEVSFEKCFYIHGGPDYLEELELVGGDAAVRCARHRRKLTEGSPEQADFASTEQRLRVMLNLDEPLPGDGDDDDDADDAAQQAAVGPTVGSLNSLLSESMRRAEGLTLATVSAIKSEAMAAADGDVDGAEALELSRSALETVRAEGVRQLSEQCTLCVAHLLQLTVGLVEVMNGDQPAPEAPTWPEAASGKALLLRHFARHMVSTLDDVVEVYMTALSTSAAACDGSEVEELSELSGECDEMRSDLRIECGSASSRVQDALNHLVALLLVTTLPEEEEDEEQEEKDAVDEEAPQQETPAEEEGEEAAAVEEVVAEEGQEAAAEEEAASAQPVSFEAAAEEPVSVEAVPEKEVSVEAVPEKEVAEGKEPAAEGGGKGKGAKGKNKKKSKR